MFFVRSAGVRDLAVIRQTLLKAFDETYLPLLGALGAERLKSELLSEAALKERLSKPSGEFLVADDGKVISAIGYASMSTQMAKTAVIEFLHVLKDYQRQGIGKDMFAELEGCFPDAEIMRVELLENNNIAHNFYKFVGFDEVDRLSRIVASQDVESIAYEKRVVG